MAEGPKTTFTIRFTEEMSVRLNRLAARRQLASGRRVTITSLILEAVEDFLAAKEEQDAVCQQ